METINIPDIPDISEIANYVDKDAIIYSIVGLVVLYIVIKLLKWPIKLFVNGLVGVVLLYITNYIGADFGVMLPVNATTALISGILGIPGIIFLVLYTMML